MSLDQPDAFVKHQTVTRDAFLGGRLTLSQPRHGFRAGLDSVLLGASIGEGRRRLLDLGAGVGTAAFVALALNPGLTAMLVEREPGALELARSNAADTGFGDRATGVEDSAFDVVIANPPFFDEAAGTQARDTGRAGARHMEAGMLDRWVKTAAGAATADGEIVFIYPAEGLAPLLSAFTARFGAVTVLPLSPRADAPASRVLVRGTKGSRAPLRLLGSRPLHEEEGRAFRPQFDAIFRGQARLDW